MSNRYLPFTKVTFDNGVDLLAIPTNKGVASGVNPNIYIKSQTGMFSLGESSSEGYQRKYSEGFVLNPNAVKSGKNIMIELALTGETISIALSLLNQVRSFFNKMNLTINTDLSWLGPWNAQYVNFEVEDSKIGKSKTIIVKLYFITKESI